MEVPVSTQAGDSIPLTLTIYASINNETILNDTTSVYGEIAYERTTAASGGISAYFNCQTLVGGSGPYTKCKVAQQPWCTAPPDMNIKVVNEQTIAGAWPTYEENFAICLSFTGHQPYLCSTALSFPEYFDPLALGNCSSHP